MANTTFKNVPRQSSSQLSGNQGLHLSTNFYVRAFAKRQWEKIIVNLWPQYGPMMTLLGRLGAEDTVDGPEYCWQRKQRLYYYFELNGDAANPDVTQNANGTITMQAKDENHPVLVTDVLILPSFKLAFVQKVDGAKITIEIYGAPISVDDFKAPDSFDGTGKPVKLAVLFNNKHECFCASDPRQWSPEQMCNGWTKFDDVIQLCDEAMSSPSEIIPYKNGLWKYWQQDQKYELHKSKLENVILMGNKTGELSTGATGSWGILPAVRQYGLEGCYTGDLEEQDIQDYIDRLAVLSPYKKFFVFHGNKFGSQFSRAMQHYTLNGGVDFGSFSTNKGLCVGLNITCYSYNGIELVMVPYMRFNDEGVFPVNVGRLNMSYAALFLGMGKDPSTNTDSIRLKCRLYTDVHSGKQVKNKFMKYSKSGLIPRSGDGYHEVSSDCACYREIIVSEVGVQILAPEHHGFFYKAPDPGTP